MKKNAASASTAGLNNSPPAAVHPITGGIAPTKDPGTTARANFFFIGVYIILYQKAANHPRRRDTRLADKKSIIEPSNKSTNPMSTASPGLNFPDGIGRDLVLFINASVDLSW